MPADGGHDKTGTEAKMKDARAEVGMISRYSSAPSSSAPSSLAAAAAA